MFVIVRHGNTFMAGEPARRIGARTDLPLTEAGVAQGHALGVHFAGLGWGFGRVLVSPLLRTRETAQAILVHQPSAPTPEPCDWLREVDHGPDENQPEDAVVARLGAAALSAWDTRGEVPSGWIVDPETRMANWRALFDRDQVAPTLVVTSNGAARFALLAALDGGSALPDLKLPTGGYGVIRRDEGGRLEVPVWGRRP